MKYVFDPPVVPSVPVLGSDSFFPVHRIYCVARNYADHIKEMGGDPDREPPSFFAKPADAVKVSTQHSSKPVSIPYPSATTNLHYEVELVVAMGKPGVEIDQSDALNHVFGYAVGVDLTRRDLQAIAKENRGPWDSAKGFDQSAPIGSITPVESAGNVSNKTIWLKVNGQQRQAGNTSQMIWTVPEIIAVLSQQFCLQPGDLIYTGTPSGVGPIHRGETVTAGADGLESIAFTID